MRIKTSIRMDEKLHTRLISFCKAENIEMAELICVLVSDFFGVVEPAAKPKQSLKEMPKVIIQKKKATPKPAIKSPPKKKITKKK